MNNDEIPVAQKRLRRRLLDGGQVAARHGASCLAAQPLLYLDDIENC
jgi:hypothetical protein